MKKWMFMNLVGTDLVQEKILQVQKIFYVILSSIKVLRTGDCD